MSPIEMYFLCLYVTYVVHCILFLLQIYPVLVYLRPSARSAGDVLVLLHYFFLAHYGSVFIKYGDEVDTTLLRGEIELL